MSEVEWLTTTYGLFFMQEADGKFQDENGSPTWRSVAARVACLNLLGSEMPEGVRRWVSKAIAYLDEENRIASVDTLLFDEEAQIYAAFRDAYSSASPELRQRLAAAQDVFRGSDYYAVEGVYARSR